MDGWIAFEREPLSSEIVKTVEVDTHICLVGREERALR